MGTNIGKIGEKSTSVQILNSNRREINWKEGLHQKIMADIMY